MYACSVGRYKRQMAEICVKAVIAVADLQRKDVNLELIKVLFLNAALCNLLVDADYALSLLAISHKVLFTHCDWQTHSWCFRQRADNMH